MRLLLDTAVLIFAVESPYRLSKRAAAALKDIKNIRELSTVSLTEIAIKADLGKLDISIHIVRQAIEDLDIRVLPYTAEHAFHLFGLPIHHRDLFDRQLIAQALFEEIAIVTPDQKFRMYDGLRVIW